nr:MAG TPA: N BRO family, N-terminal domain [Bacteriophage sp.]
MLSVNSNSFKTYHHRDLNCDIRAVYINDEPWFVGNEVANLLSDSIDNSPEDSAKVQRETERLYKEL